MEVWIPVILALIGGGGIGAILKTKADNRKTVAEADKVEAEAQVTLGGGWQVMWEAQRKELNELRERVAIVERQEAECREKLARQEGKDASPEAVERLVVAMIDKRLAHAKTRKDDHVPD